MRPIVLLSALLLMSSPHASAQSGSPPTRDLYLFLFRPGPAWVANQPMAQQNLGAHGAYHAGLVREGRSVAGGGYVGMDGGMAIVRAADAAEAREILAADPAIQSGVFAAEIRQWKPRFYSNQPLVEVPRNNAGQD